MNTLHNRCSVTEWTYTLPKTLIDNIFSQRKCIPRYDITRKQVIYHCGVSWAISKEGLSYWHELDNKIAYDRI